MAKSGMFGSEQGSETTKETYSTTKSPQQKKYIKEAINLYGPTLGEGMDVYQGERVAGFQPLQQSVFDFANQGGFVMSPEQVADYYRGTIREPAEKAFAETTLPAVREAYSGPGYWGSNRAQSEIKAREDLTNELNEQWAKLNWDVLQANKAGAATQYGLGTEQQQYEQELINADMQKFAEENQLTDPTNLSVLMNLLGMNVQSSSVSSQSTTEPSWHTSDWSEFGTKMAPIFL